MDQAGFGNNAGGFGEYKGSVCLDGKQKRPALSMYRDMMLNNFSSDKNISWKLRVPLKIKIFLWYLKKGVILTKDNLAKRKWKGDKKMLFL